MIETWLMNDQSEVRTYLSHVILTRMYDQTSTKDAVDTIETNMMINHLNTCNSISIGNNVSQVSNMSCFIFWRTMTQLKDVNIYVFTIQGGILQRRNRSKLIFFLTVSFKGMNKEINKLHLLGLIGVHWEKVESVQKIFLQTFFVPHCSIFPMQWKNLNSFVACIEISREWM